jgi:6-phosphogluconolactonase (cycloisomerase 2 family)
MSVACSPDGANVYVSSGRFRGDNAVSVFRRYADGTLEPQQEFVSGQDGFIDFAGGNEIAVTADGAAVYAVGSVSHSIACFSRDPQNGRLTFLESLVSGLGGIGPLGSAAGLGLSMDDQFVYVAAEQDGAIAIFRR